jgi:hypothetical protein
MPFDQFKSATFQIWLQIYKEDNISYNSSQIRQNPIFLIE